MRGACRRTAGKRNRMLRVSGIPERATCRNSMLVAQGDLLTVRVSKAIREVAGKKALLQASNGEPVFAVTKKTKEQIIGKIRQGNDQVLFRTPRLPAPVTRSRE
jgi:hypothetical protein